MTAPDEGTKNNTNISVNLNAQSCQLDDIYRATITREKILRVASKGVIPGYAHTLQIVLSGFHNEGVKNVQICSGNDEGMLKKFEEAINDTLSLGGFDVLNNNNLTTGRSEENTSVQSRHIDGNNTSVLCVICLSRKANTLILNCRHLCVCFNCSRNLTSCPVCRQKIEDKVVAIY